MPEDRIMSIHIQMPAGRVSDVVRAFNAAMEEFLGELTYVIVRDRPASPGISEVIEGLVGGK